MKMPDQASKKQKTLDFASKQQKIFRSTPMATMEDALLRITLLEAQVGQLAALVTRCCSRAGVMESSDFDEVIAARMDEQEKRMKEVEDRFKKLQKQLENGVKRYLEQARINFD